MALDLRYFYEVGHESYRNDRYIFGQRFCDKTTDAAIAAQHPVGSVLQIHYNPNNAADSVVIAGRVGRVTVFGTAFFSFILVLIATFIFVPNILKLTAYKTRSDKMIDLIRQYPDISDEIHRNPRLFRQIMKDPSLFDDLLEKQRSGQLSKSYNILDNPIMLNDDGRSHDRPDHL